MTKFIRQKFSTDCGFACVAMFAAVNYETVVRHASGYELVYSGLSPAREVEILLLFGLEVEARDSSLFDKSRPAIITVGSLNGGGRLHGVFWDGKKIFDPQKGRRGKDYYVDLDHALENALTVLQEKEVG